MPASPIPSGSLVLVTGASGYVGGRLVTTLLERGYRVRCLLRTPAKVAAAPWFGRVEIVDRFCIVGPPEEHIRRLEELKGLGVDQFALYLQHDDKDHTLAAYGEKVIPAIQEQVRAKE